MSNQIETGCKAVIMNSVFGNDGIIVTVGERVTGDISVFHPVGSPRWFVDIPLKGSHGVTIHHAPESSLQRIAEESLELFNKK